MTTIEYPAAGVADLRARIDGEVIAPDEPGWDQTRQAYNLLIDQRPELIAVPVHEGDVVAIVRYAAEHGLRVAPQRTGHNAAPLGDLEGTVLLKTDAMRAVEIDAEARIARVQSGAKWKDVLPQASELGLAGLHGSTADVSLAGYSLGGGLSWYGRKHGLQTNNIIAIELVTADGELRRVDHQNEPGLFWALRGGGGNFGVVTAIEVQLYAIPDIYAGVLFFPWERSSEVLQAWREWTETVPEELTSVGRILQFPPIPDVPEPLRGNKYVLVEGIYMGDEASGRDLMQPIRELGPAI